MRLLRRRRLHPNLFEDHFRELCVVDLAVVVGVRFGDHLLDFVVRELLPEVHHAVLELGLADVAVAVAVEHPGRRRTGGKETIR